MATVIFNEENTTLSKDGVRYYHCLPESAQYASDEYKESYFARLSEMMNRKWTNSEFIEQVFAIIDKSIITEHQHVLSALNWECGSDLSESLSWGEVGAIGFLNPRRSCHMMPFGYKVSGTACWDLLPNRWWDIRWRRMNSDGIDRVSGIDRHGIRHDFDDVPANFTNIASTVIVTETPDMINVLEAMNLLKLPKIPSDEVFLVLGEKYLEKENEELAQVVENEKESGVVIDTRDWIGEEKFIDKSKDLRGHKWHWTGYIPDDIAEEILANHLIRTMDYAVNFVQLSAGDKLIRGDFNRNVYSSMIFSNALAMDKDFISFPTLLSGDGSIVKGNWRQILHAGYDFLDARYSEKFQQMAQNIKELDGIIKIWERELKAADEQLICPSTQSKDPDAIFKIFFETAKRLGVDDSIATLRSGVPIEDILA